MPKYNVEVTFDLATDIEFDGNVDSSISVDGIVEVNDGSYFSSEEIRSGGGQVDFVIEADDEGDAESKAREAIADGHEYEDSSGLTWVAQDVNYSVELAEMDRDTALEIIQALCERLLSQGVLTEDEKQAIEVILNG